MKFTISTSFYKRGDQVEYLYNQVKNQTHQDWEWIVTDDFSSENSAKEALLDIASKDSRVKYFEQSRKKELFYNPNRTSTGDLMIMFDSDDFAYPKTLEIYNHMFLKHPEVMGICCESHTVEHDGSWVEIGGGGHYDYGTNSTWNYNPFLRSWRNTIPEFDNGKLKWYQNDANIVRHVENKGKWLFLPRVLYKYVYTKDSFSKALWSPEELEDIENERLFIESKFPHLDNPDKVTYSHYYYPINYLARDFSISRFNFSKERKKVLYINSNIKPIERSLLKELFYDQDLYFDINLNIKFDDIIISLNPETLSNIETIASTLQNNHLGTEVVIKYDEHYKMDWNEVAQKLVDAFGGYSWCKGGYEVFIHPSGFFTEKLYEFNR
jgi:glycosyltransferase involved in cell wall biosynthesis